MSNEEAQAKALLTRSRDWHRSEAARISRILEMWDDGTPNTQEADSTPRFRKIRRVPLDSRPSVRTLLLELMNEADRDWSAGEVLHEYERRGKPVRAADPSNALRAAISESNKAQQIFRTSAGRYKSVRWRKDPLDRPLNGHDYAAHRFDTASAGGES